MGADVSLILEYPGMTEEQVMAVVLDAPGVVHGEDGKVLLSGKYWVDIYSTEPGDCLIDLIDWEEDGAARAIESLYYLLADRTPWRLWTDYEDVCDTYASMGIRMKERPALPAA